jgi:replicative DNA helicase
MENKLPYNAEAEQAVLASILLVPDALFEIDLEPRDFWNEQHKRLYALMQECVRDGETPDLVTVAGRSKNPTEATAYMASLMGSVISPSLIFQYADVVRTDRIRRELLNVSTLIADVASNRKDLTGQELVSEAQGYLTQVRTDERGEIVSFEDAVAEYMPTFQDMLDAKKDVVGIPTGLDIDRYIGGAIGGDMTLVAGEPGKGKTSLAMQAAFEIAKRGHRVLIFSLEMAKRQYMLRSFSTIGNVNSEDIKRGRIVRGGAEYERIMDGVGELVAAKTLLIVDTPQTTDSMRAHLARLDQQGLCPEFVAVDSLGELNDRIDNEVERVNILTRILKQMARQFDTCMWVLHGVNRLQEISLRSLRYGGGYQADEVIICNFADDRTDNSAQLHIVKNRNGDTCIVPMVYRGEVTRWDNPEKKPQAQPVAPRRIVSAPPTWDLSEFPNGGHNGHG